jgi:hypothetical protein
LHCVFPLLGERIKVRVLPFADRLLPHPSPLPQEREF